MSLGLLVPLSVVFCLLFGFGFPGASAQEALQAPPITSKTFDLALETQCVLIRDSGVGTWIPENKPSLSGQGATGITVTAPACDSTKVVGERLSGTGDLLVTLKKSGFIQAQQNLSDQKGQFVLFLNGVALPNDAVLLAAEHDGDFTILRYRVRQGPEVQKLWSMLYADGALYTPKLLNIALGWKSANGDANMIPTRSTLAGATAYVSVSMMTQLLWGLAIVVISVVVLVYLGLTSDTLRDAPDTHRPAVWEEAFDLWHKLKDLDAAGRDREIRLVDASYTEANRARYERLALRALGGERIQELDVTDTKLGLALQAKPWQLPRATFSLSRTQLALWFAFAVATGVFLWFLYGDLRRIDGSLLALLGISVGTAGVSWATDRNADGRPFMPSRGFWADLITGFDERKQLHRYQAVVVNLLLLVVGGYYVLEQLNYPVFDSTWLMFLGISGGAYSVGKQILEAKP